MWYEETANDVFKAGVTDDKFTLLSNSNKTCRVAVKTPWGSITNRITLDKLEMQGTVPAPLKASVQLDTLGKECIEAGEGLNVFDTPVTSHNSMMVFPTVSFCVNDRLCIQCITH